ncbi:MAG: hypothetical protein V7735_02170 [Photobacterium frigidiphilum]|uniref:hypothetical protein n=1 Tax=Photobacterium frigidiphilum TaxID=264736 RepID=UPI00300166FE
MKLLVTFFLMMSFAIPSYAWADKGHGKGHGKGHKKHHHNTVVVVQPKYKKKHHHHHNTVVVVQPPRNRYYHHSRLPEIATFAVIAGISYAIVDNVFYKKSGDRYDYVDNPRR